MEDFALSDGANVGWLERDQGYRPAVAGNEFDLEGESLFINVYDGAHVSGLQPVLGE